MKRAILVAVTIWMGAAQTLSFEVASIKANNTGTPQFGTMRFWPGGRYTASNVTLKTLVESAYHIVSNRGFVTGGPSWVDTATFDIEARPMVGAISPSMSDRERVDASKLMLQRLLTDRFTLVVRRETKSLPIYRLVRAKSGAKLTKATARDCAAPSAMCGGFQGGAGYGIDGHTISMLDLSEFLTRFADRVVRDATGLRGEFDVRTTGWATSRSSQARDAAATSETIDPNGPSLFTVLEEQLGLKLEPAMGPVDTIVIERASRPDDN